MLLANDKKEIGHMEERYWLDLFSDEFEKTKLPYSNNNFDNLEYDQIYSYIEGEMYAKLKKLSGNDDYRSFMALFANLNCLLTIYTESESMTVGTSIFKQQFESHFINTILPIHLNVDGYDTFKQVLMKIRDTVVAAEENQNYQMNALIYNLGLDENDSFYPLFDIALLHLSIQDESYLEKVNANLLIMFNDDGERLNIILKYNRFAFQPDFLLRFIENYTHSLNECMSNPDAFLVELDLINAEEKQILFHRFNSKEDEVFLDTTTTIHGLFETAVEKYAENVAVVFENEKLTYSELNIKSNSLARQIMKKLNNTRDNMIPLIAERSLEMIIGILAVLKSGNAYVPIDIDYPQERKEIIIKDCNAPLILVRGLENIEIENDKDLIDLLDQNNYIVDSANVTNCSHVDNIAYSIYTSGSTGEPNGVVVKHKSILNTLLWRNDFYAFNNSDVFIQIPSFSFDSSVEDIFNALLSGAKLVLLENESRFDANYISKKVKNENATHFLITPSLYKLLLMEHTEHLKSLRIVTIAGDNSTEELVGKHFEFLENTRLINEYGPCENSVCSTVYEFKPNNLRVLIGKPIKNVQCFVLNKCRSLCPIGVYGELYLSGRGLTEGYLNKPDLTEENFIDNPFCQGEKMYKTGDIVRWLDDGNIEFWGRSDSQIKIRGMRIEIGEIEKQLLRHEDIKDTVILVIQNNDEKSLIQFYVSNKALVSNSLKDFLRKSLPLHMVPTEILKIDEIPLTINGKIDNKKLFAIYTNRPQEVLEKEDLTETEKQLMDLWKETLNLDYLSKQDNFFEVGGHSLKAFELISSINKSFNKQIPLKEIFINPTIQQFADYIMKN